MEPTLFVADDAAANSTQGFGTLDRVFGSVCSNIMNFNFKPYDRPVHWPTRQTNERLAVLASGAPSRTIRRGRR
jgi:hypothetical protein